VRRPSPAEELLQSFGVTTPEEIDLEAIAYTQGVRIYYQPLDGCEARIIGIGNDAIVTVNNQCSVGRQRYSIGHELGHWKYHRGRRLVCRSDEIDGLCDKVSTEEATADKYAASLLMPAYLFIPILRSYKKLDFDVIRKMAEIFQVSITAAAIRCIELGDAPAMVVCHTPHKRGWFRRSSLASKWFPRSELQPESSAFDVLFKKTMNSSIATHLRTISAEAWFDSYYACRYEVQEQTFKIGSNEVLTLLILDDDMLEE
jgi:Zn-dependent peptidase ImmA (M78 family)